MSPTRRANGEGTVYKRQDGRWEGAAFVLTSAGVRERRRVYGRTREEAHRAVTKLVRQSHQGLPVAATAQSVERFDGQLHFAPPKTRRSERSIPLPDELKKVLLDHRARQEVERAAAGPQWKESGLVFTTMIGTPIEPNEFSRYFRVLAAKAGLSNVRLHDLRHTCASMLLAKGSRPVW